MLPGGNPVTDVPGHTPTLPVTTVGPVFVTAEPASTPKLLAVPSETFWPHAGTTAQASSARVRREMRKCLESGARAAMAAIQGMTPTIIRGTFGRGLCVTEHSAPQAVRRKVPVPAPPRGVKGLGRSALRTPRRMLEPAAAVVPVLALLVDVVTHLALQHDGRRGGAGDHPGWGRRGGRGCCGTAQQQRGSADNWRDAGHAHPQAPTFMDPWFTGSSCCVIHAGYCPRARASVRCPTERVYAAAPTQASASFMLYTGSTLRQKR